METEMRGLDSVKEYYGKILKSTNDLKTSACCTTDSLPVYARALLKNIDDEIKDRFYGCGSPFPLSLKGKTVLDLGCGTGRDVYLLSQLVGPTGRVIGVDMTDEQLEVAKRHKDSQMKRFGFDNCNVEFIKGYIEDLESAGIRNDSVDVVTSNCVVNLSPYKRKVFSEIFRVLKPGGELYFSDVFADRRAPKAVAEDEVMIGECLGGALYKEDFRRMMAELGCPDFRVCSNTKIDLHNPEIQQKAGLINFYSITVRAFKMQLEDRCEDFGQVATYLGTIAESPNAFLLDDHHLFEAHRPMLVCGNTASMIQESRYGSHFRVTGDKTTHFGLFDCAPETTASASTTPGACC